MNKYVVTRADGSVDVDASTASFRAALVSSLSDGEALQEKIETAVEAVFDSQPGRLPKDMLIDNVLAKLGATGENHASLTRAVEGYLRANTSKDKGADGRRIAAIKGIKGGMQRLARPGEAVTALVTESK